MNELSERENWIELEMRVTRKLAADEGCRRLGMWCDGFAPNRYVLEGDRPLIEGVAWICFGKDQQPWTFSVLIPRDTLRDGRVEWGRLSVPEEAADRITVYMSDRRIEVEPKIREGGDSKQSDETNGDSRRRGSQRR